MILQNIGKFIPDYMVARMKIPYFFFVAQGTSLVRVADQLHLKA
jgi:hypothetical protein